MSILKIRKLRNDCVLMIYRQAVYHYIKPVYLLFPLWYPTSTHLVFQRQCNFKMVQSWFWRPSLLVLLQSYSVFSQSTQTITIHNVFRVTKEHASVVSANPTATTLILNCYTRCQSKIDVEGTLVIGPSTAAISNDYPAGQSSVQYQCTMTPSLTTGECAYLGIISSSSFSSTNLMAPSNFELVPLTITAGIEKLPSSDQG